jgi:hypothetical protein
MQDCRKLSTARVTCTLTFTSSSGYLGLVKETSKSARGCSVGIAFLSI